MTGSIGGGNNAASQAGQQSQIHNRTTRQETKSKTLDKDSKNKTAKIAGASASEDADGVSADPISGSQGKGGGDGQGQQGDGSPSELHKAQTASTVQEIDETTKMKEKMKVKAGLSSGAGPTRARSGAGLVGDKPTIDEADSNLVAYSGLKKNMDPKFHQAGGSRLGNPHLPSSISDLSLPESFAALVTTGPAPGAEGGGSSNTQGSGWLETSAATIFLGALAALVSANIFSNFSAKQITFNTKHQDLQNKDLNSLSAATIGLAKGQGAESQKEGAKIKAEGKMMQAMAIINDIIMIVTLGAAAPIEEAVETAVEDALEEAVEKSVSEASAKGASSAASSGADASGSSAASGSSGSSGGDIEMTNMSSVEDEALGEGVNSLMDDVTDEMEDTDSARERDRTGESDKKAKSQAEARAEGTSNVSDTGDDGDSSTKAKNAKEARAQDTASTKLDAKANKILKGTKSVAMFINAVSSFASASIKEGQAAIEDKLGVIGAVQDTTQNATKNNTEEIGRLGKNTKTVLDDQAQLLSQAIVAIAVIASYTFNAGAK